MLIILIAFNHCKAKVIIRRQLFYKSSGLRLLQSYKTNFVHFKCSRKVLYLNDSLRNHLMQRPHYQVFCGTVWCTNARVIVKSSSIHTSFHRSLHLFVYIHKHICISNDQWKLYWPARTSSSRATQRRRGCFFLLKCKPLQHVQPFAYLCMSTVVEGGMAMVVLRGLCVCCGIGSEWQ